MIEARQELLVYTVVITSAILFISGVVSNYGSNKSESYSSEAHFILDVICPNDEFFWTNDSLHFGVNIPEDNINGVFWSLSIKDIYGNRTIVYNDVKGNPETYYFPIIVRDYNYSSPGKIYIYLWK